MRKRCFIPILLLANSCMMAPQKYDFDIAIPEQWRMEVDEASTVANVRWWREFKDPFLNDLICESLEYNKDLEIAIARVQEFEGLYRIVRAELFPLVTGAASGLRQESSIALTPLSPGVSRFSNLFASSVNLSYELDVWGRIRSATEAALQELLAQEDAQRTVVLTVVTSVANGYIQLLQFDEQIKISIKTLESRKKALHFARVRFENGFTSELEVKQADSEVEAAEAQLNRFEVLRNLEENALCILVGRNPGPIARGRSLDDWVMIPSVPVGLPSDLLEQRPDIREAEHRLIAADMLIGVARAAFFPKISLTGLFGFASPELRNLFSHDAETWAYGASALQPIFTGGRLCGQLEAAEAIKQEALYGYEQVIQNAFREVNDALYSHQKALELLEIQRRRITTLGDYLRLARLQHENGQTDYLNVLDAERNLFASQLDFAEAESNIFGTLVNLFKALGGGWVTDLE